jgi:hypothetical protein
MDATASEVTCPICDIRLAIAGYGYHTCPGCGQRIEISQPNLPPPIPPRIETPRPAFVCPQCLGEIPPEAKRCRHCGARLKARESLKFILKMVAIIGAAMAVIFAILFVVALARSNQDSPEAIFAETQKAIQTKLDYPATFSTRGRLFRSSKSFFIVSTGETKDREGQSVKFGWIASVKRPGDALIKPEWYRLSDNEAQKEIMNHWVETAFPAGNIP